ncbi:hypothetical protein EDB85DRAFT_592935 [Lactarius pseudohatsudake]|nr:hypothetical protein EDB85DRAFT_592935 [Lactarius pseudohatsudake]
MDTFLTMLAELALQFVLWLWPMPTLAPSFLSLFFALGCDAQQMHEAATRLYNLDAGDHSDRDRRPTVLQYNACMARHADKLTSGLGI